MKSTFKVLSLLLIMYDLIYSGDEILKLIGIPIYL